MYKMNLFKICILILGFILCSAFCLKNSFSSSGKIFEMDEKANSLPLVYENDHADYVAGRLKNEAYKKYMQYQVPENPGDFEVFRQEIRQEVIEKAGILINHSLPLDYHETGSVKMNGYTIKNIYFQTLPGVYATANLYIPDGIGPFPAILNSNGHWEGAKMSDQVQWVSQTLALNGYVSLCIDAFGSGERSTTDLKEEYHGANLGASLMNIGKSLLGLQVSESMRGIDLLCSLPFVDPKKIGATGASGGGNRTKWIAAMDERVKAAVPVVSVGSFESCVMGSNCVCELLIDGLTMTEEAGILALVAPRSILMVNHTLDRNSTFFPSEMLRSYNNAKPVFEMLGIKNNIGYRLFNLEHDYIREDIEAALLWFNSHLKGNGALHPSKEAAYIKLPFDKLKVFQPSKRDSRVLSIQEYCKLNGRELKKKFIAAARVESTLKRDELQKTLRISHFSEIKQISTLPSKGGWDRIIIESSDGKLIPILHFAPRDKTLGYTILSDPKGKRGISGNRVDSLKKRGSGIVIVDLFGIGENESDKANSLEGDHLPQHHTLSRAELWLGKTIMGEWVDELNLTISFLQTKYHAATIHIDTSRELALAGLYLSALQNGKVKDLTLREAPLSYLFDTTEGIDFFSMGIHLPGLLVWGDVSLALALSDSNIRFVSPVTMSGKPISGNQLQLAKVEFDKIHTVYKGTDKVSFK